MNVEENRLQTFSEWPSNAAVTPQRIAKAGFFYIRHDQDVECFACHLKISEWNYGDQVMARHKFLSPSCPFVLNPSTSGNIPIISLTNVPSSSTNLVWYRNEDVRLASFDNWPATDIVTPERLARAGFYYLKDGDSTKCAFCKGTVRAWEPGDDPDSEHKRHFPSCSFVMSVINPRLNNETNTMDVDVNIQNSSFPNVNLLDNELDGNLDELGVQKHKGPKRPNYGTLESRLRSFTLWPPDLIQTSDILAQAGFYYEGMGDQVRCFHCDGGLRHWDPHDDPWTEHARWFPGCAFVKLVKGQEFVVACALENNPQSNLENVNQKIQSSRNRREVSDRELQEHMISPPAMAALGIGINAERVKRAIKEKLQQTGRSYSHPDALVEAALNLQLDENDEYETETQISSGIRSGTNPIRSEIDQMRNRFQSAIRSGPNPIRSEMTEENKRETDAAGTESDFVFVPTTHVLKSISLPKIDAEVVKLQGGVSLEEENRQLKEARLCKICMDGEVCIVFLPCGHLATCVNCAPNLEDCPVCRGAIKATVRTFLS